jgi:hypothetical protein
MVIEIKKGMSKADMDQALSQLRRGKRLDARKFLGSVKWSEDALAYQRRLRDEWN